jgi:predicted small secreted protein
MTTSQNSLKRVVALIACAAITVGALSACNTVEGAGKDVKSTGKAIEKTAHDSK